ncbi:MAG: alpha/beta hydrolase [Rhodothermales bacterium]
MKCINGIVMAGLFLLASPAVAQVTGSWAGHIALPGLNLEIKVSLMDADGGLKGTIDIPQQGANGLPLQNVRFEAPQVSFELAAGPGLATFDGTLEQDTIEGSFKQGAADVTFTLQRMTDAEPSDDGGEALGAVSLDTGSGTLHGTLLLPDGAATPTPVVLIIAGSGPTDRDGNTNAPTMQAKNNSLKFVAEALAEAGIASLRYDKRGVAASMAAGLSEADLRFEHYAEDAAAWVAMLKDDARFSTVTVLGHSEGALVGLVALDDQRADGYVSLAGSGRPARALISSQLSKQLPPDLMTEATSIMDTLERGETVAEVPAVLQSLFRPSIQGYIGSWFAHDPATKIGALDVPVLVIQGSTDIQVSTSDAELLHAAQPNAQFHLVGGMNHVLKAVSGTLQEQLPSYSDPDLPLHDDLMPKLIAFINGL